MTERTKILSIGSVVGGQTPNMRAWDEGVVRLARKVASARDKFDSPLNVNVIFHVAGDLLSPEFSGVRTGYFSKEQNWLIVQVAINEEPTADVDTTLKLRLQEAVNEAERWARRRKIARELLDLKQLVESV